MLSLNWPEEFKPPRGSRACFTPGSTAQGSSTLVRGHLPTAIGAQSVTGQRRTMGFSGRAACAPQEKPAHRCPRRRLPKNRISSARPDACCRRQDRRVIESPCASSLLPCSGPRLGRGCNRSWPESGRPAPLAVSTARISRSRSGGFCPQDTAPGANGTSALMPRSRSPIRRVWMPPYEHPETAMRAGSTKG
jgi:hypothetical protein